MPLKYKKLTIVLTFFIMVIGFITFSVLRPGILGQAFHKTNITKVSTFGAIQVISGKSVSDIQDEIHTVIQNYFDAKQKVDMQAMKNCVSDCNHVDQKKLIAEAEYVEGYENLKCKILDGPEEGSYRVYAYYDVKIYNIDTVIPSLTAFYVKQNAEGNFEIYLGTIHSGDQKIINKLDNTPIVKQLVSSVQKSLSSVISSDSNVRSFYEMLENEETGNAADTSKKKK